MRSWTKLLAMGVMGSAAALAQADVVAQWSFGGASLDVNVAGSGSAGVVRGAAAINAGPAVGAGFIPALQNGYLSVPRTDAGSTEMNGLQTSGADAQWNDYIGNTLGSTTVAVVFRPGTNFNAIAQQRTIFNHHDSPANKPDGALLVIDNTNKLYLEVGNNSTTVVPKAFAQVWSPAVTWRTDTWYLLVASWESDADADLNDGAAGHSRPATVYVRALAQNGLPVTSTALTGSSTSDINSYGNFDGNLTLGMRDRKSISDTLTSGFHAAAGDFALMQLYNNYMTVAQMDALYSSLIPEPSTAVLSLSGAALLWSRRRR